MVKGKSSKVKSKFLTGARTDRPRLGTDRFSMSVVNDSSVFDGVFMGHKLIEKDSQPLEAVKNPFDKVNTPLNPLILENFMLEYKFNRKTFVSAFDVLRDPGSFTLDVAINKKPFRYCVLDSGSSMNVMSLYLARAARIHYKRLEPSKEVGIMLVDDTHRDPRGFASRVPVDIEGRIVHLDFLMMDAIEEFRVVLGRPFLFVTQANLNYEDMSVKLHVDGEWFTYKKRTSKHPMELIEIPRSPLHEERQFDDESRKRKRDNLVIVFESSTDDEGGKVKKVGVEKEIELVKDPDIEQWLYDASKKMKFERDDDSEKVATEAFEDEESLSDACSSSHPVSPTS